MKTTVAIISLIITLIRITHCHLRTYVKIVRKGKVNSPVRLKAMSVVGDHSLHINQWLSVAI